jgi:hypothetical protein
LFLPSLIRLISVVLRMMRVMTLGQLRLLASCIRASFDNHEFRSKMSTDELAEADSLASMFEDHELETADCNMVHGFCL